MRDSIAETREINEIGDERGDSHKKDGGLLLVRDNSKNKQKVD
ncbi:MAG: hypothetical protein QXL15_01740 [Candidatus Korarchaeota archaeon]